MAHARVIRHSVRFLSEDDLALTLSFLPRSELDRVEQTCRQLNHVVSQYMASTCLRPVMSVFVQLLPEGPAKVVVRQDAESPFKTRVASSAATETHFAPILRSIGK